MTYLEGVLIALDQFINAILGGWPDETLSSRCWRWSRDGVFTITWPKNILWDKGTPPDLSPDGTDILVFYTESGGEYWYATVYGTRLQSV